MWKDISDKYYELENQYPSGSSPHWDTFVCNGSLSGKVCMEDRLLLIELMYSQSRLHLSRALDSLRWMAVGRSFCHTQPVLTHHELREVEVHFMAVKVLKLLYAPKNLWQMNLYVSILLPNNQEATESNSNVYYVQERSVHVVSL